MGIFGKSEERKQADRLKALLTTAMKNNPRSGPEQADAFEKAVEGLRSEGAAAEDFMLKVASDGVPMQHIQGLWYAIFMMGEDIVPGVAGVLKTGVVSARCQASMSLSAFAECSPATREACVRALRDAAAHDKEEAVRGIAGTSLQLLVDKGIA